MNDLGCLRGEGCDVGILCSGSTTYLTLLAVLRRLLKPLAGFYSFYFSFIAYAQIGMWRWAAFSLKRLPQCGHSTAA